MVRPHERTNLVFPLAELFSHSNRVFVVCIVCIFLAAFEGHVEVVKVLIEAGAAVNALTDDNRTPLYQAVFKGNNDAAHELIKAGADPSIMASTGKSAVDIATDEAIKELLATSQPPAKKRKVDEDAVTPADVPVATADKEEN